MTGFLIFISVLICLFCLWLFICLNNRSQQSISESELNIVLCESHKDVKNNVSYRLTKDSDNVIRIKQDYPLDSNDNWVQVDDEDDETEWYVKVSGVSNRKDAVIWFMAGTSRKVEIVKESMPDYPYALAVYGKWKDKYEKIYNEKLGYVEDCYAQEISEYLNQSKNYKLSAKLRMMFIPTEEKMPGLRINIAIFELIK